MVYAVDGNTWVWHGGEWRRCAGGGVVGVCVGGRIVVLDEATAERALASATLRAPPKLKTYSPERSRTTHHLRVARRLVRKLTSLLETAPTQLTAAPRENISTSVQTHANSIPAATACRRAPPPSVPSASNVAASSSVSTIPLVSQKSLDSSSSSPDSDVSYVASSSESDSNQEGPSVSRGEVHVTGNGNALKVSGERVRVVRAWLERGRVPVALQGCWRHALYQLNPIVSLTPSKLMGKAAMLRQCKLTSPVTKPGPRDTVTVSPKSRLTRKQDTGSSPKNELTKPGPRKDALVSSPTNRLTKQGPRKHDRVASPMNKKQDRQKRDRVTSPTNQITKPGPRKHTLSESPISQSSPTNSSSLYQFRQPYSAEEDEKLVKWLCQDKRWERVGGVAMWRQLEASVHLPNRSWQSLKNRYYKNLLQRLHTLAPLNLVHEMRASARPAIRSVLDKKKTSPRRRVDKAWAR